MNQITTAEKNKTTGKAAPSCGAVTPLTMAGLKSGNSERMKELKKPRSRKYIQYLIELQEMLSQLDKLRKEIEVENKGNNDGIDIDKLDRESSTAGSGNDISNQSTDKEKNSSHTFNAEGKTEEALDDSSSQTVEASGEKEGKIMTDKDYEMEALTRRIQAKLDSMAKESSIINGLLTLIYPSSLESYLLSCGVIKARGWSVHSRDDMANSVDERDPGLIEHLKRAYDIYMQYWETPGFLCIEIYRDAYCLIYRDGIVRTII